MGERTPWRISGPLDGPAESKGLEDALKRLYLSARRKPTEADRPPPSIFPVTKAARAALRYTKESRGG